MEKKRSLWILKAQETVPTKNKTTKQHNLFSYYKYGLLSWCGVGCSSSCCCWWCLPWGAWSMRRRSCGRRCRRWSGTSGRVTRCGRCCESASETAASSRGICAFCGRCWWGPCGPCLGWRRGHAYCGCLSFDGS